MAEHLVVERQGPVARVELNRPDVHNAFNQALLEELIAAFTALEGDDDVRAIVLTGRGRSFCAGADLSWMRATVQQSQEDNVAGSKELAGLFELVDRCPKPVVGRIQGAAIGGGTGLVAACDISIAAARAKFGFSEVRLGLAPAVISPFVVARIGPVHARELFLTGERFRAERARAIGLVNRVAEDEEALDEAVDETLRALLQGAPKAQAACKELARTVASKPREQAFDETARLIAELRAGAEGQEGMMAFMQRRAPSWSTDWPPEGDG